METPKRKEAPRPIKDSAPINEVARSESFTRAEMAILRRKTPGASYWESMAKTWDTRTR